MKISSRHVHVVPLRRRQAAQRQHHRLPAQVGIHTGTHRVGIAHRAREGHGGDPRRRGRGVGGGDGWRRVCAREMNGGGGYVRGGGNRRPGWQRHDPHRRGFVHAHGDGDAARRHRADAGETREEERRRFIERPDHPLDQPGGNGCGCVRRSRAVRAVPCVDGREGGDGVDVVPGSTREVRDARADSRRVERGRQVSGAGD